MKLNEIKKSKQGTYAGVRFDEETENNLTKYIKDNDIPNPVNEYHATLLFSRNHCPNYVPIIYNPPFEAKAKEIKVLGDDKAIVLILECPELAKRHEELMKEHDATWDYPEYIPHVTLTYDPVDIKKLTLPSFKIKITKEYLEQLDL